MTRVLATAAAGVVGTLLRYGINVAVGPRLLPWGTLFINIVGSFALGVVLALPDARLADVTRTAVAVGLLGAFTTFSTFAFETTALLRDDRAPAAAAYTLASVVLAVAASAAGYTLARTD